MAADPGFHGKSPTRGDFLTRRVPPAALAVWDGWLSDLMQASRAALGPAWLEAWLVAPIWHASIGAGILGPVAWQAVLIPSVDRVGRHFPFTILGARAEAGRPAEDWAARAEPLALAALDDDFSPDALAAALAELGPPGPADMRDGESGWQAAGAGNFVVGGLPAAAVCAHLVRPSTNATETI